MLFFSFLIFLSITFIQPQCFVPAIKNWPLVYIVMLFTSMGWIFQNVFIKKINIVKSEQNTLMIIFWILVVLSTIKVNWLQYSFNIFIEWSKVVIIFFLMISIIDSEKKIKIVLWIIIVSMGFTAFIGILQHYGTDLTGAGTIDGRVNGVGIFGTNQLAYALCFSFPFLFALFLLTESKMIKLFLILLSLIYLCCLYFTESRGGQLCLLAVILLLFTKFTQKNIYKIISLFFIIFLFVIMLKFAPRFSTTLEYQTDESALGRLDAWGSGLILFKSNPLLGIGKDQFAENVGIAPHSSYIQVLTELGFFGLFIWLGFFYYSITNLNFMINNIDEDEQRTLLIYSKTLQISLYAYLIGSYFSSSAYYIPLFILFALVVILKRESNLFDYTLFNIKHFKNILLIEIFLITFIHLMIRFS